MPIVHRLAQREIGFTSLVGWRRLFMHLKNWVQLDKQASLEGAAYQSRQCRHDREPASAAAVRRPWESRDRRQQRNTAWQQGLDLVLYLQRVIHTIFQP